MAYSPRPIRVDGISLPSELAALAERLAENAHDLWAQARINAGWVLGPSRDDDKKTHPSLVAYAQLPESEKDLDRRTAMGTITAILALGFQIIPPRS